MTGDQPNNAIDRPTLNLNCSLSSSRREDLERSSRLADRVQRFRSTRHGTRKLPHCSIWMDTFPELRHVQAKPKRCSVDSSNQQTNNPCPSRQRRYWFAKRKQRLSDIAGRNCLGQRAKSRRVSARLMGFCCELIYIKPKI